ncbi:hypothetical protein GUJ93_ZPchr0008g13172 [Zizania palustris]|uniref:CONSTANS-like protein n=1 Tax=Zizania palustris TaxID=103762 RepID=A0A8J5V1N8_ZIZPA|nr:hypothetical protein GUJ93_ZPchr0008g13172 [Zizania palustris]
MMGSEGGSTSPPNCGGGGAACAVCGGAAAVYCAADAAALCAPCDAAVHAANPLASRHERVPLVVALAGASSGVYDLFAADDDASSWPARARAPAQGSPNDSSSSFSNDSAAGAERSLFDLLSDVDIMACGGAGLSGLVSAADVVAPHGEAPLWLLPGQLAASAAALTSWSPPESAVVPTAAAAVVAAAADREARVRRYREKRKNRKFQKTIRYASRKAYAEARPRIKGRFVKRASSSSSDDDSTAAGAGATKFWLTFSDGVGFDTDAAPAAAYGVVPTF